MADFNFEEEFQGGDEKSFHSKVGQNSDAAFLFVLITFQFLVTCFGIYMFYKKMFGSPEYKKEKKVTPFKLYINLFLIVLNGSWMYHTYTLILLDKEIQASNWDPWTPLDLQIPSVRLQSGFNTPEVKKAYRKLAKLYHPDKVKQMSQEDQIKNKEKWNGIIRAYETLTEQEKFDNWIQYGNPEGSLMSKSIELAIPSFFLKEENQVPVLIVFFISCVCVPMLVIYQTKGNDISDLLDESEIHQDTKALMLTTMFQILDKNISKKVKGLTELQLIEIFEQSVEMQTLNDRLAKKINIRDLIKKKLGDLDISDKFQDAEQEVDSIVPKLTCCLANTLADKKFQKDLQKFNEDKKPKIEFTSIELFKQLMSFANNVMKMKKNGYNGYQFTLKADNKIEKNSQVDDKNNPIQIQVNLEINHLDWKSIKEGESAEIYQKYKKGLGIYLALTNKESNLSQIYKINLKDSLKNESEGLFQTEIKIQVLNYEKKRFNAALYDNFGFKFEQEFVLDF